MINHWEYIHHLTTLNRGFEVPDLRDDLQRVAAPAEVCVWEAEKKTRRNLRGDGPGMISGSSSPQIYGIYGVFIWWEMGEKTMVNGGFDGNFNVFF